MIKVGDKVVISPSNREDIDNYFLRFFSLRKLIGTVHTVRNVRQTESFLDNGFWFFNEDLRVINGWCIFNNSAKERMYDTCR